MALTLERLNDNQRRAAEWGEGPLLVLAGPGSGKTAVLTLRIATLIKATPEENFHILGLTFTVKAANEMQNRLKELLGEYCKRVQLRTFHSFCTDILRQHGSHFGLRPDFSVVTDDKDRIAILKTIHDHTEIEIAEPEDYLKKIDTMFTHGIFPEDLPNHFAANRTEQCQKLQNIFHAYIAELLLENQLDFGSMLYLTRRLLSTKPRIARQVRTVYRYICVDEFQDTNIGQYQVLKQLVEGPTANLFVVADDDQVIFQWNGADPKRLEELKSDFSPTQIQLPENYRCPQEIVEMANRLIKHNSERLGSKIEGISHNVSSGAVYLEQYDDFNSELEGLATWISAVDEKSRCNCLVIARSNKLLTEALNVLNQNNIEAEIVNKCQDYSSPLMLLLYYCLKLLNAPDSKSVLNKLCAVIKLLNNTTLSAEEIITKASVNENSYLRTFFQEASQDDFLKPICNIGIDNLCDSLQYKKFIDDSMSFFDSVNIDDSGKEIFPDYLKDKDNWMRITANISASHGDSASLHLFLQEMDLTPKTKPLPKTCVRLQTVHTAKGMEFNHVYVIGLVEDQFPSYFAIKSGASAIEEERRNCFVAITRASFSLYLSYANEYFGWSKTRSRFLDEMGLSDE